MKKVVHALVSVGCLIPLVAFAEWQVVQADVTQPFVQTSGSNITPMPEAAPTAPASTASPTDQKTAPAADVISTKSLYQLDLQPGTLQENLQRLNALQGNPWDIKWLAKDDYIVTGHPQVSGNDFYEAIGNLLQYYPVRAIFYKQNHVLAIVPKD